MTIKPEINNGFTLVELAIVIVIIGLLVGGVLQGQELIRQAGIRSVIKDMESLKAATILFKDKYKCLPGDCANATTYFGAADSGDGLGADCISVSSLSSPLTCNGNGDSRIGAVAEASPYTYQYEAWRYFQQLAAAKMIKGAYTGTQTTVGFWDAKPGTNIMETGLGVGITPSWYGNYTSNTTFFDGNYDNTLVVGGYKAGDINYEKVFTPTEAFQIDSKIDDGKPGLGTIKPFKNEAVYTHNCASGASDALAEYNNSLSSKECILLNMSVFN